ncbi:MAG: type I-B CRISPR-associated protein Cas5 [Gammaproteobacteria bacterium]|nr:type I-B CRISPR-associated protein Cas5 [Gammaproteobacteria bacterium]
MDMKLISIDLKSNFGFFKKPDINDSIYLTYNMIHKPALLGLLGAILGLEGHKSYGVLPEYYKKLQSLKIGVEPIGEGQKNGNFEKTTVKYNNATGHASAGTLNILEQILIKPAYRIYLELDENEELYGRLKNYEAVFIPYLGKNDFPCWWENFKEDHGNVTDISSETFKIKTIFRKPKDTTLSELREQIAFGFIAGMREKAEAVFSQFERLPTGFNEELKQYSEPEEFVYTNMQFTKDKFSTDKNFKQLENGNVVYLF